MTIVIKNGIVADGMNPPRKAHLLVQDGKIITIGQVEPSAADTVIDAAGCTVMPGLVDMHVHLRDPGQEYKEDIKTGTQAAAMGGVTSLACMPNTTPVNDNKTVTAYMKYKAAAEGCVHVYPIGAITKGLKGEELAGYESMIAAGAVGFSDDGRPVDSAAVMKKAMAYIAMLKKPIIAHCEDLSLTGDGVMNAGLTATAMGLHGIPASSEQVMIARDILLCRESGAPVHFAHVSTAGSIDLIRKAKQEGLPVTCETAPHYFTLTESACEGFNTLAKVNPPLRSEADRQAVVEGLLDGTIDVIATDHAPHSHDEKQTDFQSALCGLCGLETLLALSYTKLVKTGILPLEVLLPKIAAHPADILGLEAGRLCPGSAADIIVVDFDTPYTIQSKKYSSKSKNAPYDGMEVFGRVLYTLVDGKTVVADGHLV